MTTVMLQSIDGFFWLDMGESPFEFTVVHDPIGLWQKVEDQWLARQVPGPLDGPDVALEITVGAPGPDVPITDIVAIGATNPLQLVSAPTSYHEAYELQGPGSYLIGFTDLDDRPFGAFVMTADQRSLDTLLGQVVTAPEPDNWYDGYLEEKRAILAAADQVLQAMGDVGENPAAIDPVLADVTVRVTAEVALGMWRDIDSGWLCGYVNPAGPQRPNAYVLTYLAETWGQDELTMVLTYLTVPAQDTVRFRVEYLRNITTEDRLLEEPIDAPHELSVSVSPAAADTAACVVRQDACPAHLLEPLAQLWRLLTAQLSRYEPGTEDA